MKTILYTFADGHKEELEVTYAATKDCLTGKKV